MEYDYSMEAIFIAYDILVLVSLLEAPTYIILFDKWNGN